jgi:hypothetical protein
MCASGALRCHGCWHAAWMLECHMGDGLIHAKVYMPHLPAHPLILNICHFFILDNCVHSFYVHSEPAQGFCVWESGLLEILFQFQLEIQALSI